MEQEELIGMQNRLIQKSLEVVQFAKEAELMVSDLRIGLSSAISNLDKKLEAINQRKKESKQIMDEISQQALKNGSTHNDDNTDAD